MNGEYTELITFRVSKQQRKDFERRLSKDGVRKSDVLRRAVIQFANNEWSPQIGFEEIIDLGQK